MTNHPAAIACTLLSYKTVPSRKVFQITVEVAIEKASEAVALLGTPDPDGATWLALARLVPAKEEPAAPAVKAETKRSRSQIAAMKCHDPAFQDWFARKYPNEWSLHIYICRDNVSAADRALKYVLGISSKRELDTDGYKAAAWDALITEFDLREMVR